LDHDSTPVVDHDRAKLWGVLQRAIGGSNWASASPEFFAPRPGPPGRFAAVRTGLVVDPRPLLRFYDEQLAPRAPELKNWNEDD